MAGFSYGGFKWSNVMGNIFLEGRHAGRVPLSEKEYLMFMGFSQEEADWLDFVVRLQNSVVSRKRKNYPTFESWQDSKSYKTYKKEFETLQARNGTNLSFDDYMRERFDTFDNSGDFAHNNATINPALPRGYPTWVADLGSRILTGGTTSEASGWLGDLVLADWTMGNDDYMADLDAANIAHIMNQTGMGYAEALEEYYIKQDGANNRAKLFLEHTSIEHIRNRVGNRKAPQLDDFIDALERGSSSMP